VAKFSLRRYDTQATLGLYCSLAALLCLIVQAWFIFQHLNWDEWIVLYGPRRRIAILMACAATIGLAVIGAALGFNSAGQRRNEKGQLSWIGFFTGALVISLSIALFLLFWSRGESAMM
jgi:hypothetical protein